MKKILFVITKSNWGGAQRYVYNLATNLPKEQFQAAVALGGTGEAKSAPGQLAERLSSADIPWMYVRSFARDVSLMSDVRAFFELCALYKAEKPDIVHLNSSKAGGVGAFAARLCGVRRIVFTVHGLPHDEDRSASARALIALFTWFTFMLCDRVITVSRDNYERVRRFPFCKKRATLVHNGLPELQFETRERARVSLALRLGFVSGGEGFWVGTLAELTRNKGLAYLIDAASLLKAQGYSLQVYIVGGGEEETALRERVKEAHVDGLVHFTGFMPDAYRYLKAFDCVCLPSVKEGLPTVLLEAGMAGVPAVASDIPGVYDIVQDNVSGLITKRKDPADLAAKIASLIELREKRAQLGNALQQKVRAEFSIAHMVEGTAAVYEH